MYRVEDKYVLSAIDRYIMKERLNVIMQADSNEKNELGYKISSVYFDDIMDTHYNDTVIGNPFRMKYRIRIYNDSMDTIRAEVKIKQYNRIKKIQEKISEEQLRCFLNGEPIECNSYDSSNAIVLFNHAIKERILRPKVIVTYERKTFICQSGNVRITFDTNVRGSDKIERFGDSELVYDHPYEENSVVEVKYDEFLPDYIAQTLEMNQMWQTSFSKYGVCRKIYL